MAQMLKGKTAAGFEYAIDADALNDIELLEALSEVDTNPLKLPRVIAAVLGEDQKKAMYEHYRGPNGRVAVDAISTAFVEILSGSNQGKN